MRQECKGDIKMKYIIIISILIGGCTSDLVSYECDLGLSPDISILASDITIGHDKRVTTDANYLFLPDTTPFLISRACKDRICSVDKTKPCAIKQIGPDSKMCYCFVNDIPFLCRNRTPSDD